MLCKRKWASMFWQSFVTMTTDNKKVKDDWDDLPEEDKMGIETPHQTQLQIWDPQDIVEPIDDTWEKTNRKVHWGENLTNRSIFYQMVNYLRNCSRRQIRLIELRFQLPKDYIKDKLRKIDRRRAIEWKENQEFSG